MNVSVLYRASPGSASDLVDVVERAIATGAIGHGERLPTVRALATGLDLSPTTVAAAYRELARRGLVLGEGRRGTFVRPAPPLAVPDPSTPIPPGTVDLADGEPDPALRPPIAPALARIGEPEQRYGTDATLARLAELAAAELAADGVPRGRVIAVGGALDGLERVLAARTRPGDRVAIEDPGYHRVTDLVAALGLVGLPVAVDEDGPTPAAVRTALDRGAVALVVTPRAQNPVGSAVGPERAAALAEVLAPHPDVLVVEDDHAGPVAGPPLATLAAGRERWAVVRSVSKSLGPDLRVAVLTGDDLTVDRVEGRQRVGTGWVSRLLQRVVVDLWEDPAVARQLDHARATYTARRTALLDELAARGVPAMGRSGLNVWVPVRHEDVAVRALAAAGFAVTAGERFRIASGPGVRVTVASLDPADAPAVADALAAATRPRPGRAPSA